MAKIIFLLIIIFFQNVSPLSAQIKIGVAIPLMKNSDNSGDKKLGEMMLKGINDALTEYDSSNLSVKIILKIEDTQKDQSAVLDIFNKFGSDSGFIAIFGPVYSSELVNNAGAAAFHKILTITPTATDNFLAEKNEFVFQLNPTYDIRGKTMAGFAMKELGMKNFIILSEESYGKNFEESFAFEVNKNGGSIVFTKFYSKDKNDLSDELGEIRNKLFEKEKFIDFGNLNKSQVDKLQKIKFQFSYPDSLINEKLTVSIYKLFGKNAERILDSIGIPYTRSIDKSEKYVLGLTDAVYVPISNSSEISKVASQYFSENIPLPILGTSDWNSGKDLSTNSNFIKELYFESDFFLKDGINERLVNLDESEIKNYYFGYDGMKLILDKISEGNKTRQSLNEALQKLKGYEAEHNNVTINERTNHEMSIMIFRNGSINKLRNYVH